MRTMGELSVDDLRDVPQRKSLKYLVICEHDTGGIFYEGFFADFYPALNYVLKRIVEFRENYSDGEDGNVFRVTPPYTLEGDNGTGISVRYRAPSWQESCEEHWAIIETEDGFLPETCRPNGG